MASIGILGGTFDPPHLGHLALAQAALASGRVEQVLLIPAHRPPHKQRPDIAPAQDRLVMVRLLIARDLQLAVSDLELVQEGVSYTIQTVRALQEQSPGDEFHLVLGADMAMEFGSWREADALAALAPPLVAAREGLALDWGRAGPSGISAQTRKLLLEGRIPMATVPISSSRIREGLRRGEDVSPWLPAAVLDYIRDRGLYGSSRSPVHLCKRSV